MIWILRSSLFTAQGTFAVRKWESRPIPCQEEEPMRAWQWCQAASLIPCQLSGDSSTCLSHIVREDRYNREAKIHRNFKSQPTLGNYFTDEKILLPRYFPNAQFKSQLCDSIPLAPVTPHSITLNTSAIFTRALQYSPKS